jgi:hypothetical protein
LVVVDVPVLVWSPAGVVCDVLPAWAKLRALPRAKVHAIVNSFFILSPLKGSSKVVITRNPRRRK